MELFTVFAFSFVFVFPFSARLVSLVECVGLTASPRKGTGVLWVLTGTHPCDTSTQACWCTRAPALSCVAVWFPQTMSLALSFDLGRSRDSTFSIHDVAFVKSASSSTFNLYKRFWAGSTTHRSSWHFHSSQSYRTFQRIRGLLRFICGQLLLRCQGTLALNEDLLATGKHALSISPIQAFTLLNDSLSVTSWT